MSQVIRSPKQLGAVIRRARQSKGLTQTQVARRAGMRQATISEIENGRSGISQDSLFALLAALDLTLVADSRRSEDAPTIEDIF